MSSCGCYQDFFIDENIKGENDLNIWTTAFALCKHQSFCGIICMHITHQLIFGIEIYQIEGLRGWGNFF